MRNKKKPMPKGVLLFTPLPWRLSGAGLALALLLRDHPMSRAELRRGVIRAEGGKYLCRHPALTGLRCTLSDRQLLELVGLTQFTVDGRMFYSAAPPMSVSSTGAPGSVG